jgi:hypothetical protein
MNTKSEAIYRRKGKRERVSDIQRQKNTKIARTPGRISNRRESDKEKIDHEHKDSTNPKEKRRE